MLFRQNQYPEFDIDHQQLLTSDHLNKLFGYVDEQGRLTRANLIGIGILCGLEVNVNDAGTEITISKGCGITSLGYLVSTEARTYTEFKVYDVTQDRKYSMFVNGSNRPRFHIDELKTEASTAGTTRLTADYLQNRIVVMYVELMTENGKNCDPTTCDDKGVNVTVNLRPLLIHRDDVASYMGAIASAQPTQSATANTLPILQMRRFNVPSSPIPDSPSLLGAYQAILNQSFLSSLESTLTQSFSLISPLVADLYTGNPFAGVAARYKFLYDGSITASDLVYIQYYYDLFSDVYTAYNNFREAAIKIMGVCMPDENLFPQHLLLGPAGSSTQSAELFTKAADRSIVQSDSTLKQSDNVLKQLDISLIPSDSTVAARSTSFEKAPGTLVKYIPPKVDTSKLSFRNDFMPSAALRSCCAQVSELRWLFKRLVSLLGKFSVPRRSFTILQTYGNTGVVGPRNTSTVLTAEVASASLNNAVFTKAAASSSFSSTAISKSASSGFASPTQSALIANSAFSSATLSSLTLAAAGTPARINISTGVNASGTVLAAGAAEPNWGCPSGMSAVIVPNPAWGTLAGATWLGNGGAAPGNFVFTRTFTITSSGTINFQALADNRVTVTLDGALLVQTPNGTEYGFRTANMVTYTGIVSIGTHTLTATVYNEGGPAGLVLSGGVAYTIPAPVPPPPPPLPPPPPKPVGPIVPVRITPSFLGDVDLSDKSIPYYYDAIGGTDPLYRQWDYSKTIKGKADRNLSYNSLLYNSGTPDYVVQAMRYDLERYNFLRVEGHIGAPYEDAVKNITAIRDQYRLPFEIIALRSTLAPALTNEKDGCCTEGIELSYAILKAEWTDTVNDFTTYLTNNPDAAALFDAQGYKALLQQSLDLLKNDVPAFVGVYASFLAKMGSVETRGGEIRVAILALLNNRQQSGNSTLYEDLIDHLDELINNYKKTSFTEVYNAYKLSQTSVKKALSLQEYLKENPGIQHKAGVTLGGTFVLVYHTKLVAVTQTTNNGTAQQSPPNQSARLAANVTQNVAVAQVALPQTVTAVNYDIVKAVNELVLLKDTGAAPAQLEDKVREMLWVKDTTPIPVKQEVVNIFDTIIEGTVIADFFVPYICCEDCPTIRFVPSEDAPEQAVIKIDKKTFCISDENHYKVTVEPGGGTLTGNGLVTEADGTTSFVPSAIAIPAGSGFVKTVLTYATEGSTTFVELTVYALPVAAFDAVADSNSVTLVNNTQYATSVLWDFGDGITSVAMNPQPHVYQNAGDYTITLTASNGECPDTATQTVTIADVTLDISTDQRKFCQGSEEANTVYDITVQPLDATVTIDGVEVSPILLGHYQFRPVDIILPAGTSKTIVIKAEKGALSKTINIDIDALPDAAFTYSVNGATASFFYTPVSGNTVLWNFGGGATSGQFNPTYNFPNGAGTYPVTLTVTNKGCPQSYTMNVVVEGATISVVPGGVICLNSDSGTRGISVSPAGGVVSGEGVTNRKPADFDPKLITFDPGTTRKDVVLTYRVGSLVATTVVTVYKALNKTISVSATGNAPNTRSLSYTAEQLPEDRFSWDFGDGQFADGVAGTSHTWTKAGTYTVTLTIKNSPCPDVIATTQVVIQDVRVSLEPGDSIICLGQDTAIRAINVSPAGGVLKVDGVTYATPATFDPSKVVFDQGSSEKQVVITYTVDGITATTSVMVYKPLNFSFRYEQVGFGDFDGFDGLDTYDYTCVFTYDQPYDGTLVWDFGSGQFIEGEEKQVEFNLGGTGQFPVKLTIFNGPCASTITQTVIIKDPYFNIKGSNDICLTKDLAPIPIDVYPAGGVVTIKTGEGIVNGSPIVLDPSKVTFPQGQVRRDINISYRWTDSRGIAHDINFPHNYIVAYKALDATFTATEIGNNTISFSYEPTDYKGILKWNFGDGQTFDGTAHQVTHRYETVRTYNVTLTLSNDPCPAVKTIPVTVKGDPAGIEIAQTQFCKSGDTGDYEIFVSPAGGVLSIDGIEQPTADKYYFRPSEVEEPTDSLTKDVHLHYSVNGTESDLTLTVDTSNAQFGVISDPFENEVSVVPLHYASPGWLDMGDGNVYFITPGYRDTYKHTYQNPGLYTISLSIDSPGHCQAYYSFMVNILSPMLDVSDTRREFCANEDQDITIQANPGTEGVMTVDGVAIDGYTYAFNPYGRVNAGATEPKVTTVSYELNGATATETFTVYPLPAMSFNTEDLGNRTIRFTNLSTGGSVVSWNFGDGQTGAGERIDHTYETEGLYTVRLIATNGKCPDVLQQQVEVTKPGEPQIFVSVEERDFCADERRRITVSVSPDGGVFKLDGNVINGTSKDFTFEELGVKPDDKNVRTFTFSYTLNGTTVTEKLTVKPIPVAGFTISGSNMSYHFTNTSVGGTVTEWNFGDGQTGTGEQVDHTYAAEGTYTVGLAVSNGTCTNFTLQTVTAVKPAQPQLSVSDGRREFCMNDTGVTVTPSPAGGVFTKNGTVISTSPDLFIPSQGMVAGGSSKTVTYNYALNGNNATVVFTVNPVPVVSFATEGGNNMTYRFTNTTAGSTVMSWDFGDSKTGTGEIVDHTFASEGTYTVRLTVTNGKCSETIAQSVTVVKPEQPQILVSVNERDFCADDERIIRVSVSPSGGVFKLNGNVLSGTSSDVVPTAYGLKPGDAPLTLTFTYVLNGTTVTETLTVNPLPAVNFDAEGGNNMDYRFTNISAGSTVVEWDFGDGEFGNGEQVQHIYASEGTYMVRLTVTNGKCTSVTGHIVTVVKPEQPQIFVSVDDRDFCVDDRRRITVSVSPGGGVFKLDGNVIDGTSKDFTLEELGVKVDDKNVRTFTFSYALNGTTVTEKLTVNPLPVASFTISGSNMSYHFTNTSAGSTVVEWNFGDGQKTSGEQADHTYATEGTYTVRLTVTNGKCTNFIDQVVQAVKPPVPQLAVSDGRREFCMNDTGVTVTASPAGGVFTKNGTVVGSPFSFNPSQEGVTVGGSPKTVTFNYALNGNNATVALTVNPLPQASFGISGSNMSYHFTNTTAGSTVTGWTFGDGQSGTGEQIDHTYATEGTYTVRLTVTNGKCTNFIDQTVTAVKPAQPQLSVSDGRREFCMNDTGVTVTASPGGGVFTKNGTVVGSPFSFNPSQEGVTVGGSPKTVTFNYALNGNNATVALTVNPLPAANFAISGGNMSYHFTNTSVGGTVVEWNFGDGQKTNGEQADHTYATEGTYTVGLTVTNGKCTSYVEKTVQAVKPAPPRLTVSDSRRIFCADEDLMVDITSAPAGGSFVVNGVGISGSTYTINPAGLGLNPGAQPRVFTFSYTLNSTTVTETITVQPLPVVNFTVNSLGGTTYLFTNTSETNALVVSWDFADGDGGYGGQNVVQHTFNDFGSYEVNLLVSNGTCLNSVTHTIDVQDNTGECTLPCNGVSETSQYSWPSKEDYLNEEIFGQGKNYTFIVTRYSIDKKVLTDKNVRFDITPEQYKQQGFQAIFNAINEAFPDGLEMTYDPEVLRFDGEQVYFDIKRFACQPFVFEMIDDYRTGSEEPVYTYSEKGLLIDGNDFQYEQMLNPVIADDCIDIRPEPCDGSMTMCEYAWPQDATTIEQWMSDSEYPGYEIIVHNYTVGETVITDHDLHYVIPFNEFRNGIADAINLLNEHFLFREALYFGVDDRQQGNIITVSSYDCMDFSFDFSVYLTRSGVADEETRAHYLYTSEGSFMYDSGGKLIMVMDRRNCQPTTYIPHEPATCKLPCKGLTNTSVYTWPDSDEAINAIMGKNGKYSFAVGKYIVNGLSINSEDAGIDVAIDVVQKYGFDAIFSEINKRFLKKGLSFAYYDEVEIPHREGEGLDFTITRFACQTFTLEIVGGDKGDRYSYSEKGLSVNDEDTGSQQMLNAVMADACINTRPDPCKGRKVTVDNYTWLNNAEEIMASAQNGKPYTFNVEKYVVDSQSIVKSSQKHVIPANAYRNGWSDIAAYLNSHFKLSNGIVFDDRMEGNTFSLTFPDCIPFIFEYSIGGTTVQFNESGTGFINGGK